MLTEDSDENEILEIMKAKGCSRESAEKRLRSASVAVYQLNPKSQPYVPLYKPKPQPQPIEESEAIDDLAEQKTRILDKIEAQLDVENEFADLVSAPEWRDILGQYVFAIRRLGDGTADYFLQTVRADPKNDKIHFEFIYYKNGLRVEPAQIYHSLVTEDDD